MGFIRDKRLKKETSSFQNINHSLRRGSSVFFTDGNGTVKTGTVVGFTNEGFSKVKLDDGSGTVVVQNAELISEDEDMTDEGRDEYLLSRYKYNRRSPLPISNNLERRIIYGEDGSISTPEINGIDPLDNDYSNTFKEEDRIQDIRLDTKDGLIFATVDGIEYAYKPIDGIDIYSLYQDIVFRSKSNQADAIKLLQSSAVAGVIEGQELTEYSVGYELPTTQVPNTPQAFFPALPVLDDTSNDTYTDMSEWRDAINSLYPGVEYISGSKGQILAYAHNRNPALVGTFDISNTSGMVVSNNKEPMISNDLDISITEDGKYAVLYCDTSVMEGIKKMLSSLKESVVFEDGGIISTAFAKRENLRSMIEALLDSDSDADELLSKLEPGKEITLTVTPFDDVEVVSGVTDDGDKLISAIVNDNGEVMDLDEDVDAVDKKKVLSKLSDMERELDDTFDLTNTLTLAYEYCRDPSSFDEKELQELKDLIQICKSKFSFISEEVFDLLDKVVGE